MFPVWFILALLVNQQMSKNIDLLFGLACFKQLISNTWNQIIKLSILITHGFNKISILRFSS